MRIPPSLALLVAVAAGCGSADPGGGDGPGGKADDPGAALPAEVPTRIIWLIGDGMGVGQVTAAAYARGAPLRMMTMPQLAVVSTHAHEFVTTDSAAAASAMAGGEKTHVGGIGVLPGTGAADEEDPAFHLETAVERAEAAGWRSGLVATTSVVDATPAAFAAHRASRGSKEEIAVDLRHAGVDVLFGGGSSYFDERDDGQNLLNQLRGEGYSVATTPIGLRRVAGRATRAVALLHRKDMPEVESGERAMSLREMTEHAITVLDRENDDGFFLMVEGSWIDRKSHNLDGPATVAETLDFDQAVGAALEYARQRDDTLVLVTADHETGGLTVLDPPTASPYVEALGGPEAAASLAAFPSSFGPPPFEHLPLGDGSLRPSAPADGRLTTSYGYLSLASRPFFGGPGIFFFATHTATMVPLFAEGPGAEFVTAVRDNADLGARVKRLVAADGAGAEEDPAGAEEADGEAAVPENVVMIVSDGVGLSALSAAAYARGRPRALEMPVVGLTATHTGEALVSPAPAAASALAGAGGGDLRTLLERAEAFGVRTGVVTTSAVASEVPAAFYGPGDPAERLISLGEADGADGLDLVFGGGRADFDEALVTEWEARGVDVETAWSDDAPAPGERVARLVAERALPPAGERGPGEPSLARMTELALEGMDRSGEPFFLVVYGDGPPRALSGLEREEPLLDELADVDGAVRAALLFAAGRGDTAVVVVSLRDSTLSLLDDHYGFHRGHCGVAERCGGPEPFPELSLSPARVPHTGGFDDAMLQEEFAPIAVLLQYAWLPEEAAAVAELPGPASANFTPLFATGPGAERLEGFGTLRDVRAVVADWLAP